MRHEALTLELGDGAGPWQVRGRSDPAALELARGHYSRRHPDALWLGKSNLTDLARCPGLFDAVRAGERGPFAFSVRSAAGRLAHKAIELEVAGREERDPLELVEQSAERLGEDGAFSAYWGGLDGLQRDENLMDAAKTLELFRSTMPPLRRMRRELAPSTEWHVRHCVSCAMR